MKSEMQEKLNKDFPKIFRDTDKTPQESCMAFGVATGRWMVLDHSSPL